jgi:MerR family transcriptional regulator, mercuric resistance operon regulatory protein
MRPPPGQRAPLRPPAPSRKARHAIHPHSRVRWGSGPIGSRFQPCPVCLNSVVATGSSDHGGVVVFPIGLLAQRTGCGIETIRYYERIGMLTGAERSAAGYRLFGSEHVARLRFIRRARELGFSLNEVRALLQLDDEKPASCAAVRELATRHLAAVRLRMADLQRVETALARTVRLCRGGKRPRCPLIESIAGGASATDRQARPT